MSETTTPAQPAPVAEQPKPQAPTPVFQAAPETSPGEPRDEANGETDWRDRFEGQRKVNRDLESKLKELMPLKTQMEKLASIFGEPVEPGKDVVTTLQEQVAEMRRDTIVSDVARRHGITDDTDVELLRNAKDEATMLRLAERLKATNAGPSSPAPDPSQGSAPMSEAAAAEAAYEAFYPSQPRK